MPIQFDQHPVFWIREIDATDESSSIVSNLELGYRQRYLSGVEDPHKPILEQALRSPIDSAMHIQIGPHYPHPTSSSSSDASNEGRNFIDVEQLETKTRAEGALDQPRTRRAQINDCTCRRSQGNSCRPHTINMFEIKRLVNDACGSMLSIPAPNQHVRFERSALDHSPRMGRRVM
ncbi:MAG: hypothetical protein BMS9Abin12_2218 [Acidimicrobiia bacterium]|nr:MAG: hypothetical protein BMS9Abin12_2218 [Acidimicrobiia bacterium]